MNLISIYWNISQECVCANVIRVHAHLMHTICHVLSALTKTHEEIQLPLWITNKVYILHNYSI